jgi:ATP-binding cassette, subfamily C, bacterial LapB
MVGLKPDLQSPDFCAATQVAQPLSRHPHGPPAILPRTMAAKLDQPLKLARPVAASVLIASIVSNVLSLVFPLVMLQVYDRILPLAAWGTLGVLASVVVVSAVLDGFLKLARSWMLADAGARYEHELGLKGLRAVLGADLVDFAGSSRGSYLNRFNAIDRLREHHYGQGPVLALDVPFALIFLALIWIVAGRMVCVPLALLVAFLAISFSAEHRLRQSMEQNESLRRARSDFLLECIEGMHTLKALTAEAPMQRRYERLLRQSADAVFVSHELQGWVQALGGSFSQIVMASFVAFGSVLVVSGELTVGALAAGTLLAGRVLEPALKGLRLLTSRQAARFSRQEFDALVNLSPEPLHAERSSQVLSGRIEVQDLSFQYPGAREPILHDLQLTVMPGEMVGIVGANGAGKSTLLNLLMGFMPPSSGSIRFDDIPVDEIGRATLRSQLTLVPQESMLFDGTLLDNLTFYREGQAVVDALDYAHRLGLDETFARLPDGVDTRVNGIAESIPPGLRQRIALVRALVGSPSMVLFDEANTGFDATNDLRLTALFKHLKSRTTCLVVTQRPSLLRLCDRVLDLCDGQLIERPRAPTPTAAPAPAASTTLDRQVA